MENKHRQALRIQLLGQPELKVARLAYKACESQMRSGLAWIIWNRALTRHPNRLLASIKVYARNNK